MQNEILMMADAVSREKGLGKEVIFQAIEAALAAATCKLNPLDIDARVEIDRDTGEYQSFRTWEIIDDESLEDEHGLEYPDKQLLLSSTKEDYPELVAGDVIEEGIEPVVFGRIAAQAAKQVIMQKVREAEREQIVSDFDGRQGEMITGIVKGMERGDAIVEINGTEALLPKRNMIPREGLRKGDRIRAILEEVRYANRGPQLLLSRISPELLIKLFELEVPEVGEGLIKIHGAARDPGSRAKIAVQSMDGRIDPVGACVGMRGSRVQSVSNEIAGERVDIIKWSPEIPEFVINSLAPAEILSIMIDEENHAIDVIVDETQLAQAIGRSGQNVQLASKLTDWVLNVMSESGAEEKGQGEAQKLIEMFTAQLDVDEDVAMILVQEGFTSVMEVAYVPRQEMEAIEEFDDALIDELRNRAADALLTSAIAEEEALQNAKPDADLLALDGMDEHTAKVLANSGVVSQEGLAELAIDELLDIQEMDEERARQLIMTARAPWFE
ncbi:MAG: transcription termination factor NusA [Gammaproteobacteria bacterium]|nr:MAG: transcription termination factor NusA [Gammaproteobacteria bacterium]